MSSQPLAPARSYFFQSRDDSQSRTPQNQQHPIPQSQFDHGPTVGRSIIHQRSTYGFSPIPEPTEASSTERHDPQQSYNPLLSGQLYQEQSYTPPRQRSPQQYQSPLPRGGSRGVFEAQSQAHFLAYPGSAFENIQAQRRAMQSQGPPSPGKRDSWNEAVGGGATVARGAGYDGGGAYEYDNQFQQHQYNDSAPPPPPHQQFADDGRRNSRGSGGSQDLRTIPVGENPHGASLGYSQDPLQNLPGNPIYNARENWDSQHQVQPRPDIPLPQQGLADIQNKGSNSSFNSRVKIDAAGLYTDNPYNRYSTGWDPALATAAGSSTALGLDGAIDVMSDDEDEFKKDKRLKTGALGTLGAAVGLRHSNADMRSSPGMATTSEPRGSNHGLLGNAGVPEDSTTALSAIQGLREKEPESDWLRSQRQSKKRTKWIALIFVILLLLGAAGGIAAKLLLTKKSSGGSTKSGTNSSLDGTITSKYSPAIQAVLNNPQLHKVFPGMDYTPLNAVYPDCLTNPPSQDNVTIDVAIMSQLTGKVRLYGTDCDQIKMVLEAVKLLEVDTKVWLGVWVDNNATTNARQLAAMYELLDNYPLSMFAGVAVGNEVLFRQEMTKQQLIQVITDVKTNLTKLNINLPVATSDLGSNWDATLASAVDVIMANVHPFFAGVEVSDAANWTVTFFDQNDAILVNQVTSATKPSAMISEVGWPSGGGKDEGSVAGISELNQFMSDFVCQQNSKGLEYFWFEAFDEPWKQVYNVPSKGEEWEDKWGLFDANRNFKDGVKIPSC